jgi:hypothetical protein
MPGQLILDDSMLPSSVIERIEDAKNDKYCFRISWNRIRIEDTMAEALEGNAQWKQVEIIQCSGNVSQLISAVMRSLPNLERFTYRHMRDADSFAALAQGLCTASRTCPRLSKLRVEVQICNQYAALLEVALRDNETVTELNLYNSSLEGAKAAHALARGLSLNRNLRRLDLSYCRLRDVDICTLIQSLQLHPCLEELDLSGNYCRGDGMAALIRLLLDDTSSSLKSLNLTNQHAGEHHGELDISMLGLAIRSNTTLRNLDLSFNQLHDCDITNLIAALQKNSTLQALNLMTNQITNEGIHIIASCLPKMKGLKKLHLTSNRFGEAGAKELSDGLISGNVELTNLTMPRGFESSSEINFYLALNKGGRKLLFHPSGDEETHVHIPLGLWPLVLERVNRDVYQSQWLASTRADVMFYLLQGPALFDRDRVARIIQPRVIEPALLLD